LSNQGDYGSNHPVLYSLLAPKSAPPAPPLCRHGGQGSAISHAAKRHKKKTASPGWELVAVAFAHIIIDGVLDIQKLSNVY
jgi:hypothetical protein